jgi:hypothetical protein
MKISKPIIETAPNGYGFGHDWTLVTKHGSFYLGQDSKFCARTLGMRGSDVADAIGSNDLTSTPVRRKLAAFILQSMGLDESSLEGLQPWELCCQ